jgi:hypothetical protein
MKKIKFLCFIYLVILIFTLTSSLSAFSVDLGNIKIYTNDRDSIVAGFLAKSVIENQERIENFFSHIIDSPVIIILAYSEAQFRELGGLLIPEWSAAIAIPEKRFIMLKPADYFDPEVYTVSLLHELAHIYLAERLGENSVPLWLNEGIAMYISNKTLNWTESTIAGNAVLGNNLLSFSDIDELIRFRTGLAQIAYIQSFLSVQYFIEIYGEHELKNLINAVAGGISVNEYLSMQLGLNYEDFEFNTVEWIKDKYWWMIFLQFENLLWILILLLVMAAIVIIKIRNRRKIIEWTSEDILNQED